jgi:hypothetical protein
MLTSVVDVTTVLGSLSLFCTAVGAGLWWLWSRAKERAAEAEAVQKQLEQLKLDLAAVEARLEEIWARLS